MTPVLPQWLWQTKILDKCSKNSKVSPSLAKLNESRLFLKLLFNQNMPKNMTMNLIEPKDIDPNLENDPSIDNCYEFVDSQYHQLSTCEKLEYFTMFFFHGGGFILFHPQHEYKVFLARMAKMINQEGKSKIRILAIDYQLGPEVEGYRPNGWCNTTENFFKINISVKAENFFLKKFKRMRKVSNF